MPVDKSLISCKYNDGRLLDETLAYFTEGELYACNGKLFWFLDTASSTNGYCCFCMPGDGFTIYEAYEGLWQRTPRHGKEHGFYKSDADVVSYYGLANHPLATILENDAKAEGSDAGYFITGKHYRLGKREYLYAAPGAGNELAVFRSVGNPYNTIYLPRNHLASHMPPYAGSNPAFIAL